MANTGIYHDIAERTGGNIYLGVVGPVRTGKSTFVKRFMELMVLPNIQDPYRAERARDELPQSGSGRTIMTTEPKFVPEEAVSIAPDESTRLQVRLIDSVGYMVDSASGAEEEGQPRMVTTPWFDRQIPLAEAAAMGTQKVMQEHCTVGIVVTTDGSVTDIPRRDYERAEQRAIRDMQATGKPFVVVVNSTDPAGEGAQAAAGAIRERFGVDCLCADCQNLRLSELCELLRGILMAFPLRQMEFYCPGWVQALEGTHPLRQALYGAMRAAMTDVHSLRDAESAAAALQDMERVTRSRVEEIDLGSGAVRVRLQLPEHLFYEVLGQAAGMEIEDDAALVSLLREMAGVRREYEQLAPALESVRATGYGIVMPAPEQRLLERPELCRRGGSYGIRLKASAPSIHLLRTDILTEISPTVGDEQQSRGLVNSMQEDYETDTEKLWNSNIFGKSVYELISDGFSAKLANLPEDARLKLRNALNRIVNDGANGLICIII